MSNDNVTLTDSTDSADTTMAAALALASEKKTARKNTKKANAAQQEKMRELAPKRAASDERKAAERAAEKHARLNLPHVPAKAKSESTSLVRKAGALPAYVLKATIDRAIPEGFAPRFAFMHKDNGTLCYYAVSRRLESVKVSVRKDGSERQTPVFGYHILRVTEYGDLEVAAAGSLEEVSSFVQSMEEFRAFFKAAALEERGDESVIDAVQRGRDNLKLTKAAFR